MIAIRYLFLLCFIFPSISKADNNKFSFEEDSLIIQKSSYYINSKRQFSFPQKLPSQIKEKEDLYIKKRQESYTDTLRYYLNKAKALKDEILNNDKLVGVIKPKTLLNLPVGISKTIGGIEYMVMIESVALKPDAAYLNAMMSISIPQQTEGDSLKLVFAGRNIRFSSEGGLMGEARMALVGDIPIKLNRSSILNILAANGATYVDWDCNGFKSMGIKADVIFSRDFIRPDLPDGSQGEGNVKAGFQIEVSSWNDLIAQVNVPDFQVTSLEGFGFSIKEAVIDLSDTRNPLNFTLPVDYPQDFLPEPNSPLWQGISIKELRVSLPQHFSKKGVTERTSFQAFDLILDAQGFTGTVVAQNLINKDEGRVEKWAFSLDSLSISIQANQLQSASFRGAIRPSLFDNDLNYTAIINPADNAYIFNASYDSTFTVSLWKATMDIYPSSYFELAILDGSFQALAKLDGKMSIQTEILSIPEISFERFMIGTQAPYIGIGNFSLGEGIATNGLKLGNFPISISDIGFKSEGNNLGIQFNVSVNLSGKKDGSTGFSGLAQLTVFGELNDDGDLQSFAYKNTEVSKINIDIDGGGFKLRGSVEFFRNDEVYGRGFQGLLDAEFKPGIKLQAMALFGHTGDYRYWYADALISFRKGIPIGPGFALFGFGGGAYYHMERTPPEGNYSNSGIGVTPTGIRYQPNQSIGLGIKAYVNIGTKKKEVFNGEASFEIVFNSGGGLRYVGFEGKAQFLSLTASLDISAIQQATKALEKARQRANALNERTGGFLNMLAGDQSAFLNSSASGQGAVTAVVKIDYDVPNRTLHGDLEVFVDIAGILTGIGPNKSAGKAVLHFAPDKWYIHIGTPERRIGLELLKIARTGGYFMVGHDIPEMPPPPDKVISILGLSGYQAAREETALKNGYGLAFGASFEIDTGDLTFLIFYARFAAGAGFDIMLKNYGSDARCKGETAPLGINGWYAQGQAYAYVEGEIGVKVNLFFKKGKFKILSMAAAVLLQAKLPNPSWFKGTVGGRFSILGGLVSGNCRFELTIGKKCEIVGGSALNGIQIISEATPQEQDTEVDVFTSPQVIFTMSIGKVFKIIDVDDIEKSFRVKLEYLKLSQGGNNLVGDLEWNQENDVVAFKPFDVLPPEKDIKISVKVSFEELRNGVWVGVKSEGQLVTEELEQTFKSGQAPDYIPWANVDYTYPIKNQLNLYKNESNQGYIVLKQGQPYLFEESSEWTQIARYEVPGGSKLEAGLSYESSEKTVEFGIPDNLSLSQVYNFHVMNTPLQSQEPVDANIDTTSTSVGGREDIRLRKKQAQGNLKNLQEKSILGLYFKTSQYTSLASKLNTLNVSSGWSWPLVTGIHELGSTISGNELFDRFEILGGERCDKPLIEIEAILDNSWYENGVYNLVYKGYPVLTGLQLGRPEHPLGIPASKATYIRQYPSNILLSSETLEATANMPNTSALIYNLPWEMSRDYLNLSWKAATLSTQYPNNAWIQNILSTPFPSISSGNYKVKVRYILPGRDTFTSEKIMTINNP